MGPVLREKGKAELCFQRESLGCPARDKAIEAIAQGISISGGGEHSHSAVRAAVVSQPLRSSQSQIYTFPLGTERIVQTRACQTKP